MLKRWQVLVALAVGLVLVAGPLASPASAQGKKKDKNKAQAESKGKDQQPEQPRFTASGLTMEQIVRAREAALEYLYEQEPNYTFGTLYNSYGWRSKYATGHHAIACWAMLDAGETYQNPPLYKRLNWVLSRDSANTYDRGMRAQMLAELPPDRWAPWIRRDAIWLKGALTDQGNFADSWRGKTSKGWGDNANGQYGVLGLWGAERSGYRISKATWERIDAYWRKTQDASGGWPIVAPQATKGGKAPVRGPMTSGAVASLVLTERYLHGGKFTGVPGSNESHVSTHLQKGLNWLNSNFSLTDKAEASDFFYYMWTIQSVGRATGRREFNNIDWFRDVSANLLNRQSSKGSWTGDKGPLLSTSFALLYLSRATDPLAVSKVRFAGRWNNRPHDIWNFSEYISGEYEYSTAWQVADLDMPAYALIESPLLYLSTDEAVNFTDKQLQNLAEYINAGGTLLINPDGGSNPAVMKSINDMVSRMYAGLRLEKVPTTHAFYNIHQNVSQGIRMQYVHNGIRPVIVYFMKDIGSGLQAGDWLRRSTDEFALMSNIYLYVTGKNPRRGRLSNNYIPRLTEKTSYELPVARIKHAGTWNPEPGALTQLSNMLANEQGINVELSEVAADKLGNQKLAFLTATGDAALSGAEAAKIRGWVQGGGTLWVDACGGGSEASQNALKLLQQIVPSAVAVPLSTEAQLISGRGIRGAYDNRRVRWRLYTLFRMGPVYQPRLQVVQLDDRPAIIFSAEDLTCGLAGLDHWSIFGYSVESARRLVTNGALLALRNRLPDDFRSDPAGQSDSKPSVGGATFAKPAIPGAGAGTSSDEESNDEGFPSGFDEF